jgi:CubicO group peptidase (beta-lactamase class C family)
MWIASCTKLATSVAAMQLVEKGLVDLDEDITRILFEWKDIQILAGFEEGTGKPILKSANRNMTLRYVHCSSNLVIRRFIHWETIGIY